MKTSRGFIAVFGILLGVVVLAIGFAVYSDYLDSAFENVPNVFQGQSPEEKVLVKKVVELRLEEAETGRFETARVSVVPAAAMGYRLTLTETDYESFAEVLVENIEKEVYETVRIRLGDAQMVNGLIISIEKFILTDTIEEIGY